MNRKWIKNWTGFAAVCMLAPAVWAQSEEPSTTTPPTADGPTPRVEVTPTDWDFGTVWQGEPAEREISIKNVGTADLTLQVKSSCGCTVPTKPQSPLPPGQTTSFKISYNTSKRKGPANQTVTITTNDPDQKTVRVLVHGEVKELIKMDPQDGIFFGQLYENSTETKSIKLIPQVAEDIKLALADGQDFGLYNIELKTLAEGKEYELTATTKPPLEVGTNRARQEVKLKTGLERMPEMTVQVHSVVVPPIQVRPTQLFVPKNLSSKLTRRLRLTYRPDQPIKVTEATSSLDAIKVEVAPPPPAVANANIAYHEIVVTIDSTTGLPDAGATITIKTDSTDDRYKEFAVPVKSINQAAPRVVPQEGKMQPVQPDDAGDKKSTEGDRG